MKRIKNKILNYILRHLFNAIMIDEVLRTNKQGQLIVGGRPLENAEIVSLQIQVDALRNWKLWQYLMADLKYLANQHMYDNSTCIDDLTFGKAMLYNINIIEKKMKNLQRIKTKKEK